VSGQVVVTRWMGAWGSQCCLNESSELVGFGWGGRGFGGGASLTAMTHSKYINRAAATGLLAVLLIVHVGGCSRSAPATAAEPQYRREGSRIVLAADSALRSRLRFERAEAVEWRPPFQFTGRIAARPSSLVRVSAGFPGKVFQCHVVIGQQVEAGEPLVTLHSPDYAAAAAEFTKAQHALALAERELSRKRDLLAHRATAGREVEEAEVELAAARADFEAAREPLALVAALAARELEAAPEARLGSPTLVVRAPQSGTVLELSVSVGEAIAEGADEVALIADLSSVGLVADVPEKDVSYVQHLRTRGAAGAAPIEVRLLAYPDEVFSGQVLSLGNLLLEETRSLELRAEIANADGRLAPGMFATATVFGEPQRAVRVPASAVVQKGEQSIVYVERERGVLEACPVTLATAHAARRPRATSVAPDAAATPAVPDAARLIVTSGLNAGAKILIQNGVLLP